MTIKILREVVAVVEHSGRMTVCVTDIIFILNRVSPTLATLSELKLTRISKVVNFTVSILRS
jgi:hypothetical protein